MKKFLLVFLTILLIFVPDSLSINSTVIESDYTSTLYKTASNYITDFNAATKQLRDALSNHEDYCEVRFASKTEQEEDIYDSLMNAAQDHTGIPYQGDYLKWNMYHHNIKTSFFDVNNEYYYLFQINAYYMTTAEQEKEFQKKADELIKSFDFKPETSEYEKIKVIYDYICKNVSYDYAHLKDEDYYLQYTAYAALINKKAVCQGYASLFYYLCLSVNVDCRIITGISHGENHAWNIVCINGTYYNIDCTWDSSNSEKEYFLCNDTSFKDHKSNKEYLTESFLKQYPKSSQSFKTDKADMNGDGKINSEDLVFMAKLISGKYCIDELSLYSADLNHDNKVDKNDLQILSDFICGITKSF